MTFKICMGNPKNKGQCDKCARLPQSKYDEDDCKAWLDWSQVAYPCNDYSESKA